MSSNGHRTPKRPASGRRRFRYSGFVPLFAALLAYVFASLLPSPGGSWSGREPLWIATIVLDLTLWSSLAWRSLWRTVLPGPAMRGGLPAFEQLWVRGVLVCGGALCGAMVTWLTLIPLISIISRTANASTAITDALWEIGRGLVSGIVLIAVGFPWLSLFAIVSGLAAAGLVAWLWRYYPWEPAAAETNE